MYLRHSRSTPGNGVLLRLALLTLTFFIASSSHRAFAEKALPACLSGALIKATIVRVIDAKSIETAGGIVIKLAAVEAPDTRETFRDKRKSRLIIRASRLLTRLTLNKPVFLVFDTDKPDRYSRRSAYVFTSSPGEKALIWVQAKMIRQGLARAFPNTQNATCIKQLLQVEKKARAAKTGLWKDPTYQVIQADNLKILNRSLGRLQLIEGRVYSVSVRRSRSYINFSNNWKRDFTVTIDRRIHRLFTQSGVNIKALTGKFVRVRGWLDRHNGPTIKVYHRAQIEILKE